VINKEQFIEGEERAEWFGHRHAHSYVFHNGAWTRGRCILYGDGTCDSIWNSKEFAAAAPLAQTAEEWEREVRAQRA
jgi:hypothetical protein